MMNYEVKGQDLVNKAMIKDEDLTTALFPMGIVNGRVKLIVEGYDAGVANLTVTVKDSNNATAFTRTIAVQGGAMTEFIPSNLYYPETREYTVRLVASAAISNVKVYTALV
jgi:hypothetical protein